jgi:Flp pilus assembly pilin Flp
MPARTHNFNLKGTFMKALLTRFVGEDSGQDLIEYGLLVGIITVASILSIKAIGPVVAGYYATLSADIAP